VDFDFFSSETVTPEELLRSLRILKGAKVLQNASQTLTVCVNPNAPVKLSFFGSIGFGRVGEPDRTPDEALNVASCTKPSSEGMRVQSQFEGCAG
jgi:hypothetical protein